MVYHIDTATSSSVPIEAALDERKLICTQCGKNIAWRQLLLLRDAFQMTEAPELYVHEDCAALYIEQHEGLWNKMMILPHNRGWMLY